MPSLLRRATETSVALLGDTGGMLTARVMPLPVSEGGSSVSCWGVGVQATEALITRIQVLISAWGKEKELSAVGWGRELEHREGRALALGGDRAPRGVGKAEGWDFGAQTEWVWEGTELGRALG